MDKRKLALILIFSAFGAIVGTHTGSIPVLVERSQMTSFAFGIAGSLGMFVNIGCMAAGGFVSRFASSRAVLLFILPASLLVLLLALLSGSVTGFLVTFLLVNACLGTMDIAMNAEASIVEHELARPVFSTFHACAMLSMAVFALLGSLSSVLVGPWAGIFLPTLFLSLAWLSAWRHLPERGPSAVGGERGSASIPRSVLTLIGLAAGFNVTCEVAAIQWSGQLLAAVAPGLAAISGIGLCFYGLCGGVMRLFGDRLRTMFSELRIMSVGLTVAVAGFAGLGLAPGFWFSALAFAAVGFGLSLVFPCLFALVGRLVPEGRASAMSYTALVGGLPRVTLPWMLGVLAAGQSLQSVFAACAMLALTALILVVVTYARTGARLTTA